MGNNIRKAREYLKEILQKPSPSSTDFRYRDIFFFIQFIKPLWLVGTISLFLTILSTALSSLLPLSSKVLIDFIIMKRGFQRVENILTTLNLESFIPYVRQFLESINLVVLSIFIIGIIIGIIGLIQKYLMVRFQQELTFKLQTNLFDHILRFPMSFFKRKQTGYLVSRVSDDVNALQYLFSQNLPGIISSLLYLSFGLAILFMLSLKLSLIILGILPVYIFINYYFGRRLRGVSLDERETSAQVSKDIQEVLSGVEVVKAYTSEKTEVQKVSSRMRAVINTRIKGTILSLFSNYAVRGTQLISALLIMWFGVREILHGSMTIGDYVAFTTYVLYLSRSVNTLSLSHLQMQPVLASLKRLMELFRMVPELSYTDVSKGIPYPETVKGEIIFQDVSFSYEENRPALKHVSFKAGPGEITALVGPSGSGKTTLVNLILKFHSPQSGFILLDGNNLKDIPSQWLRAQIGIVSQEVFLFNDTIEENIKYGRPGSKAEEVIEAAKNANIHDYIDSLKNKYDTKIGERGIQLSAGQRQRLSLARAFLKNPPILIFDEPTSALDAENEKLIKDSIKRLAGTRTIFIIAHRLSLIDVSHKIFYLDTGKLVEKKSEHQHLA